MAHSRPSKNNKDKLPAGGGRKTGASHRDTARIYLSCATIPAKAEEKARNTPQQEGILQKKEEIRKRRAKKRAFVLCTILMIIVTAAIIGIFISEDVQHSSRQLRRMI